MALRVLLADESVTIKKVMQLALQDFAVEVKNVPVGVDVVEVCKTFRPDIIFADVLLQKRNGYEVCGDLKNDPDLKSIPVVLMWSSFMDLDERLASQAGANGRLEKPFDVESLRKLVLEHVPKTRSQRLAHYLKFPPSTAAPLFADYASESARRQQAQNINETGTSSGLHLSDEFGPDLAADPADPADAFGGGIKGRNDSMSSTKSSWNMDSFDDIESLNADLDANLGADPLSDVESVKSPPSGSSGTSTRIKEINFDSSFSLAASTDPFQADNNGHPLRESLAKRIEMQKNEARATQERDLSNDDVDPPSLSKTPKTARAGEGPPDDQEPWAHQDLARFRLDLEPASVINDDVRLKFDPHAGQTHIEPLDLPRTEFSSIQLSNESLSQSLSSPVSSPVLSSAQDPLHSIGSIHQFHMPEGENEFSLEMDVDAFDPPTQPQDAANSLAQLSEAQLENIIRAQSRDVIETVVRRVVPELAADLIRQELKRLLEDSERHGGDTERPRENQR